MKEVTGFERVLKGFLVVLITASLCLYGISDAQNTSDTIRYMDEALGKEMNALKDINASDELSKRLNDNTGYTNFPFSTFTGDSEPNTTSWDSNALFIQVQRTNSPAVIRQPAFIQQSVDPRLAGFLCNTEGVNINSPFGYVYYSSKLAMENGEAMSRATGASNRKCLWIVDLPPGILDPFLAVHVRNFTSSDKASLKIFSGTHTCDEEDRSTLFTHMQLAPENGQELGIVEDTFVFVPPKENVITIEMTVTLEEKANDPLFQPSYALDVEFFTMNRNPVPMESLPDGDKLVDGPLAIYREQNMSSISNVLEGDMEGISSVDGGIYIIDNYDLVSLEGLDEITTVNGPIVIRNNVNLLMPLSWVVDWLNGLSGNITAIDLSYNLFSGPIPENLCNLVKGQAYKINLRNNMLLCGDLPDCLNLEDVLLAWDDFLIDPDSGGDERGRESKMDRNNTSNVWDAKEIEIGRNVLAGNSVEVECSDVDAEVDQYLSEDRMIVGCSPLGYTAKLDIQGEILFDHRSLILQREDPPSCAWDLDLEKYRDNELLYIEFINFYSSISQDRGSPCNEFSSGHNFYNPLLNGPIVEEFLVTIYSDVYDRGFDVFRYSGSGTPAPFVMPIYKETKSVTMSLKDKNTWQPPPNLVLDNSTVEQELKQCGVTNIQYSIVEPVTNLVTLKAFVEEHFDIDTGVLNKSLFISGCNSTSNLENLSPLSGVQKIQGDLVIAECKSLKSLRGLENLTSVEKSISLMSNDGLTSLSGLRSLKRVKGSLLVYMLNSLKNFDGLQNLESLGQNLVIQFTKVESLQGLENLRRIGNLNKNLGVSIKYNPRLTSLRGLSSLREVPNMFVLFNSALSNLNGLTSLTNVSGSIDIQYNPALEDISGLQNITFIGGTLGIMHNDNLKSLSGIRNVHTIGGSFAVIRNDIIESIELPSLRYVGSGVHSSGGGKAHPLVIDHILAISYNKGTKTVSFPNLKRAPTNVFIVGNEQLSGYLPTYLIAKDDVKYANLAYNNFSGPIDPSICKYTDRFDELKLTGNKYLCGSLPQCGITIDAEDTNLFSPCRNADPPVCTLEEKVGQCAVGGRKYSSNANELFFVFPKFMVPSQLSGAFNASIAYRYGIGTQPGLDDVFTYRDMNESEINEGRQGMLQYDWNLVHRHISMVNGQKYYVSVTAYDTMGVASTNITSSGTLIDMFPPSTSNAEVDLHMDPSGAYKIDWGRFESISGIDKYKVMLYQNGGLIKDIEVSGRESSISGTIPQDTIKNGTTFSASVTGVSGAGLESSAVYSSIITPIPGEKEVSNRSLLIGVTVGVILGLLTAAVIVAFFVIRYIRKQKGAALHREWLQKLNTSVHNYLQGSASGRVSEEAVGDGQLGSFDLSRDNTKGAVFVFTDIEGSTQLCEQDAQVFIELQETHDEIMRNALAETGGYEVDTEGDSFQCLFHDAAHAVNFCFLVQAQLLQYDWPVSVLSLKGCKRVKSSLYKGKFIWRGPKVRMAVHCGCSDEFWIRSHPTTRRLTCGGMAWDITKMLSDVGHGGQVLVSENAWKQLVNAGAEGAAGYPIFEDLGTYQLNCHDSLSIRILQASPARSPLSERRFFELNNVFMLDQGCGLNIVSPPQGKVALIALVFNEVFKLPLHDYLKELGGFGRVNSMQDMSPFDGKSRSSNLLNKLATSRTFKDFGSKLAYAPAQTMLKQELKFDQNSWITKGFDSAYAIVESVLVSLVSQFGGYIIPSIETSLMPRGCMIIAFRSSSAAVRFALASQTTLMEYPWPQDILNLPGLKKVTSREHGTPYFSGPRIAMSGHMECVERMGMNKTSTGMKSSVSIPLTESGQSYMSSVDCGISYKSTGLLEALELAYMSSGGQIILSSKFFDSHWQRGLSLSQTHMTDLGVHDVRYFDNPLNLIEILPKVLEERSGSFPPVPSERMLSVGAREAPGRQGEKIALVFTYPKVAHTFQRSSHASCAVDNFSESVRVLLSRYNGYESQEVGTGCFFLSFPSLEDALAWSVHIQLILRRSDWNNAENLIEEVESIQHGSESFFSNVSQDALFSSSESTFNYASAFRLQYLVLAQIGIVYGSPTKVTSHVQTGRADYFGPIVNLTARIAKATDPGEIHVSSSNVTSAINSCVLKGSDMPGGGKSVKLELISRGLQLFKGVKEKHEVHTLKLHGELKGCLSFHKDEVVK